LADGAGAGAGVGAGAGELSLAHPAGGSQEDSPVL